MREGGLPRGPTFVAIPAERLALHTLSEPPSAMGKRKGPRAWPELDEMLEKLAREEVRQRQAACRSRQGAPREKTMSERAAQGRLVRSDWIPADIIIKSPPDSLEILRRSADDILSQCQGERLAQFTAWFRVAPPRVRHLGQHPSSEMLMCMRLPLERAQRHGSLTAFCRISR